MLINESVAVTKAPTGGKWTARLLEANVRGSSAFYPAAAVERSAGKFVEGTHIYANHMSADEQATRPEGDVNNLIGVLASTAVFKEDGLYADIKIFEDKRAWLMERADHIGLSIRAEGAVEESDGVPTLVEISKVHSVDVVTKAGAGGKFVSILESARNENPGVPDNTKEEPELEISKEFIEALESQAKLTNELLEGLKADREAKALAESERAEAERKALEEAEKPKVLSPVEIASALREAALAPKAEARVLKAVEAGADLAESIKDEKEIAAEYLAEAGAGAGHYEDGKTVSESERGAAAASSIFGV